MNFISGRPASSPSTSASTSSTRPLHLHPSSSSYNTHYTHQESQLPSPPDVAATIADSDYNLLPRGGEGSSAVSASASTAVVPREHMFDKVVTPSDVGKLNRLVIPKQHAEKYFPLDSSTNEKGLLLNFEDRNGKPWRFRYSYWNSSQSYVMTKGWSRFVKEKRLDAGDIVSFQRGVGEIGKDRLFIDWRRRPDAPDLPPSIYSISISNQFSSHRPLHPWSPLFLQPQPHPHPLTQAHAHHQSYHHHPLTGYGSYAYNYNNSLVSGNPCAGSILYLRSAPQDQPGTGGGGTGTYLLDGGGRQGQRGGGAMVFESVPVVQVQGKAAAKRLRLFGVNMDCPISESDECDMNMMPLPNTTATATLPLLQHLPPTSPSSSAVPCDLRLRPTYNSYSNPRGHDDKVNGSMSLDLDI